MELSGEIIKLTVALIAVLNPIGNAAIFVGMTSQQSATAKRKTAFSCTLSVAIILIFSTWFGLYALNIFGISIGAFQAAGGLILTLIGLSMMKGKPFNHQHHTKQKQEQYVDTDPIAIVPLAMPIIAGPGSMATIISHMHNLNTISDKLIISGICIGLSALVGIILLISPYINHILGKNGIKVVTRIMGLILISIAFQMLASGAINLFKV